MTKTGWLSLGLVEDALPAFEAGGLRTVEAPLPRPCGPQPPGPAPFRCPAFPASSSPRCCTGCAAPGAAAELTACCWTTRTGSGPGAKFDVRLRVQEA